MQSSANPNPSHSQMSISQYQSLYKELEQLARNSQTDCNQAANLLHAAVNLIAAADRRESNDFYVLLLNILLSIKQKHRSIAPIVCSLLQIFQLNPSEASLKMIPSPKELTEGQCSLFLETCLPLLIEMCTKDSLTDIFYLCLHPQFHINQFSQLFVNAVNIAANQQRSFEKQAQIIARILHTEHQGQTKCSSEKSLQERNSSNEKSFFIHKQLQNYNESIMQDTFHVPITSLNKRKQKNSFDNNHSKIKFPNDSYFITFGLICFSDAPHYLSAIDILINSLQSHPLCSFLQHLCTKALVKLYIQGIDHLSSLVKLLKENFNKNILIFIISMLKMKQEKCKFQEIELNHAERVKRIFTLLNQCACLHPTSVPKLTLIDSSSSLSVSILSYPGVLQTRLTFRSSQWCVLFSFLTNDGLFKLVLQNNKKFKIVHCISSKEMESICQAEIFQIIQGELWFKIETLKDRCTIEQKKTRRMLMFGGQCTKIYIGCDSNSMKYNNNNSEINYHKKSNSAYSSNCNRNNLYNASSIRNVSHLQYYKDYILSEISKKSKLNEPIDLFKSSSNNFYLRTNILCTTQQSFFHLLKSNALYYYTGILPIFQFCPLLELHLTLTPQMIFVLCVCGKRNVFEVAQAFLSQKQTIHIICNFKIWRQKNIQIQIFHQLCQMLEKIQFQKRINFVQYMIFDIIGDKSKHFIKNISNSNSKNVKDTSQNSNIKKSDSQNTNNNKQNQVNHNPLIKLIKNDKIKNQNDKLIQQLSAYIMNYANQLKYSSYLINFINFLVDIADRNQIAKNLKQIIVLYLNVKNCGLNFIFNRLCLHSPYQNLDLLYSSFHLIKLMFPKDYLMHITSNIECLMNIQINSFFWKYCLGEIADRNIDNKQQKLIVTNQQKNQIHNNVQGGDFAKIKVTNYFIPYHQHNQLAYICDVVPPISKQIILQILKIYLSNNQFPLPQLYSEKLKTISIKRLNKAVCQVQLFQNRQYLHNIGTICITKVTRSTKPNEVLNAKIATILYRQNFTASRRKKSMDDKEIFSPKLPQNRARKSSLFSQLPPPIPQYQNKSSIKEQSEWVPLSTLISPTCSFYSPLSTLLILRKLSQFIFQHQPIERDNLYDKKVNIPSEQLLNCLNYIRNYENNTDQKQHAYLFRSKQFAWILQEANRILSIFQSKNTFKYVSPSKLLSHWPQAFILTTLKFLQQYMHKILQEYLPVPMCRKPFPRVQNKTQNNNNFHININNSFQQIKQEKKKFQISVCKLWHSIQMQNGWDFFIRPNKQFCISQVVNKYKERLFVQSRIVEEPLPKKINKMNRHESNIKQKYQQQNVQNLHRYPKQIIPFPQYEYILSPPPQRSYQVALITISKTYIGYLSIDKHASLLSFAQEFIPNRYSQLKVPTTEQRTLKSFIINPMLLSLHLNNQAEVIPKRYLHLDIALEVSAENKVHLFCFKTSKQRAECMSQLSPLIRVLVHQQMRREVQKVVRSWQTGCITNRQYLLRINDLAGRSLNDVSQYYIFPWTIIQFTSPYLDLNCPNSQRNLSLPIGKCNPQRFHYFEQRYKNALQQHSDNAFQYGIYISNPAVVCNYMVRIAPFSTLHYHIQNYQFDHPNRLFQNLTENWISTFTNYSDLRQLIPQFYSLPQIFRNRSRYQFGCRNNSSCITNNNTNNSNVNLNQVDEVVLPEWAASPQQTVLKMRKALQSKIVTQNLHFWIDFTFGIYCGVKNAAKIGNLYTNNVYKRDLTSLNQQNKQFSMMYFKEFGQSPQPFFKEHHEKSLFSKSKPSEKMSQYEYNTHFYNQNHECCDSNKSTNDELKSTVYDNKSMNQQNKLPSVYDTISINSSPKALDKNNIFQLSHSTKKQFIIPHLQKVFNNFSSSVQICFKEIKTFFLFNQSIFIYQFRQDFINYKLIKVQQYQLFLKKTNTPKITSPIIVSIQNESFVVRKEDESICLYQLSRSIKSHDYSLKNRKTLHKIAAECKLINVNEKIIAVSYNRITLINSYCQKQICQQYQCSNAIIIVQSEQITLLAIDQNHRVYIFIVTDSLTLLSQFTFYQFFLKQSLISCCLHPLHMIIIFGQDNHIAVYKSYFGGCILNCRIEVKETICCASVFGEEEIILGDTKGGIYFAQMFDGKKGKGVTVGNRLDTLFGQKIIQIEVNRKGIHYEVFILSQKNKVMQLACSYFPQCQRFQISYRSVEEY